MKPAPPVTSIRMIRNPRRRTQGSTGRQLLSAALPAGPSHGRRILGRAAVAILVVRPDPATAFQVRGGDRERGGGGGGAASGERGAAGGGLVQRAEHIDQE